MNEQKNLILAVLLVIGILFGFNYFYERPRELALVEQQKQEIDQKRESPSQEQKKADVKDVVLVKREESLKSSPRLSIQTDRLLGSINLKGGTIDDLKLLDYEEGVDPSSKQNNSAEKDHAKRPVTLLSPLQTKEGYFSSFRWQYAKPQSGGSPLLLEDALWQTSDNVLSVNNPVTLTYTNNAGLVFERIIHLDAQYMFTIVDKVINKTPDTLSLRHRAQIERHDLPLSSQRGFILHEGPIGVMNGKLIEIDYEDVKTQAKTKESLFEGAEKSWMGFTDKYWLTAMIPDPSHAFTYSVVGEHDKKIYQVNADSDVINLAPGEEKSVTVHFFAGAKILTLLDAYEKEIGFDKFDLAVDFGWFYFLTKPLLYVLQAMHGFLGNFGLAILLLTIIVKILFFPLANKSYRSMSRMRMLAPEIESLKQRYGNDRMKMNQAMMELYKKHQVNPMSGCLPMVIQAPVFFCLYKVLYVSLDMRHAPFYGWIQDLSSPDPTSILNLFGLLPFQAPTFLHIGAWPIIMGVTMFLQQKLNPQPADKTQAMMFMIMPFFLTFVFASFPAGLVIYWAWSNVLGILQQWLIMRLEEKRSAVLSAKKR